MQFFGYVFLQDFIQEPNIIQLGEYTNLICVLNKTKNSYFINNDMIDWFINTDNVYNNFNSKKFKILIIDNKVILQIKDISKNDKKSIFNCVYKYNNGTTNYSFMKLNSTLFVNPLFKNNMNITYVNSTIYINFKKIFPIPKCFVNIKNKYINFKNIIINNINYLYSTVNLNMKINFFKEIKIICDLFGKNFTIKSKNNIKNSKVKIHIILFLIFFVILIIVIYCKRKKSNYNMLNFS